ncbi:MAG TPA: peptide ABC transporter ATP-binding protein [Lachnospiraceae bacterium]|nr:peptide ABC transporter ATP-binding protein [Lachnospiraceae bacterium]
MDNDIILEVRKLKQHFKINSHMIVKAVDGISFSVKKGEIFGLVGESGSGKSTVAKTIMGLHNITEGEVYYKGFKISDRGVFSKNKKDIQKNLQIIFQDSSAALNQRMTIEKIIAEPIRVNHIINNKEELNKKVSQLLNQVGLDESFKYKYPSEISGGQRQRVAIARSISTNPDIIIADEPIASLDISIQAQIVTLFQKLQKEYGFTFIFIAHDLSIIRFISHRVGVMFQGKIVELAPTDELFNNPLHSYTKSLLSAVPVPNPFYERNKKILDFDIRTFDFNGVLEEVSPEHFVYK